MSETLSQLIRNTKEYSDVCDMCKDEILIYPTISGRTEYSQDEVEQITLKRIIKKLQAKEQEFEELRQYHNKCCKENAEKLEQWLEKYNQVSKDFYNGKYCNKENCNLLKAKEQECEKLKFTLKHTGLLDLMNKNVELRKALDEIRATAGHLYYQSITAPVKREKAIYSIIDKVNEVMK